MNIFSTVALVALTVVFLSGCGGGDSAPASDSQVASASAYITLENNQSADIVIGQVDMNSASTDTISDPYGNAFVYNGLLYLNDFLHNRVLVYNSVPTENNASADYVIGQEDFDSYSGSMAANGMTGPGNVVVSEGKLFVPDYHNNRVLIYNTIPTENNASADVVVGQVDFGLQDHDCTAFNLLSPETLAVANGKLIIADSGNNRVLIYNTIPTENNASADIVLGQPDFTTCVAATSETKMAYPSAVWSDGSKLAVLSYDNNRVLIWNTFPTTSAQPADIVVGQSEFYLSAYNDSDQNNFSETFPTASTLKWGYGGIFSNGTQLFVADTTNNRVLVWNSFPTVNFQSADVVLGQSDFNSSLHGTTANGMSTPTGVYQSGTQLIVTDGGNNRYLIFNGL